METNSHLKNINITTHATDAELEKLIEDVDDVTDPSSINKVLEYLECIQESDESFMRLLTEKLSVAEINWERPWYQKIDCLSRRPKVDNLEDGSETFKTGSLTKDEHELIEKNWQELREKYKLPDGLVCMARWKNRNKTKNPKMCPEEQARRFVTAFLAKGLQRNTYQVYTHIVATYGAVRKGYYSRTEEKIIELCYLHKPTLICNMLSAILGREPRGVYGKLVVLTNGKPEVKSRVKWDLSLATKFLKLLLKHTGLELDELKHRRFDQDVWLKLEQDMDQNSTALQHFWYGYLHTQLFVTFDVKLYKLKKKLLKKLRAYPYKVWTDIRWKEIASNFHDGFTPRFLYKVCYLTVKTYKGYLRAPLEEITEYALQKIKRKKKRRDKRLKTLSLNKDGRLVYTDYRSK